MTEDLVENKISVNNYFIDSRILFSLLLAMTYKARCSLLSELDPNPVQLVNENSEAPVLLLCEHAGRAIPKRLGTLGLNEEALMSHIGWDIGAEALARNLAERLNAPLILQRYSRLVIDGNRPPGSPESILEVSDGVEIEVNKNLSLHDRIVREKAIFAPMDRAIDAVFSASQRVAAFSIHSFSPQLGGQSRPWHAGFLTRRSTSTAESLMGSIKAQKPSLNLAINKPYSVDDETDWFIPFHAEARGLMHCLIEVRNDQISDELGISLWSELLGTALSDLLKGVI
tara:strand:+ start:156 stop:1010 length:855 start_codon:yes stop_codon:yes gene_type:complete